MRWKRQMNNVVDAIGSIANYFRKHGWRRGQPVAVRVKYEGLRFDRFPTGYNHRYYKVSLRGLHLERSSTIMERSA